MSTLDRTARQLDYDDLYRKIVHAHRGLSSEDSALVNARLVLLLANQVGDMKVIEEALALARETAQGQR